MVVGKLAKIAPGAIFIARSQHNHLTGSDRLAPVLAVVISEIRPMISAIFLSDRRRIRPDRHPESCGILRITLTQVPESLRAF